MIHYYYICIVLNIGDFNMNYVGYFRVSTKKQNLGLDAQFKTVYDYVNSVNGTLIKTFKEKESGKNNNRIELFKAIDYCRLNKATLVIAKLDRLSRNVSFIFALRDANISFYCCDIPYLNTLSLGVYAVIAQDEREKISERTKLALEVKKKLGYKLGSPVACFTESMRDKAALVNKNKANMNPNNRRAYSIISSMIDKKISFHKIAKYLNDNDFRTSNNCLFTATSVARLIRRYE